MPQDKFTISYAGKSIPFQLRYSKRKSLEIAVHPDGEVLVKAPLSADENFIMSRVNKRARWISRQIQYFEQFEPRTPPRQFVGGESHLYLGRNYRLKIRRSDTDSVSLEHDFFRIDAVNAEPQHIAALLDNWYRQQAETCFDEILKNCWETFRQLDRPDKQPGEQPTKPRKPKLKIRKMKSQWGNLSPQRGVTLNLELIKAPRECIEYIVFHELCHLIHFDHSAKFYRLLECCLPDWKDRKDKLELALI